jgi:hypothetical protein
MKLITTFPQALKAKKITKAAWDKSVKALRPHEVANRQLELVIEVLNGGWTPNWNDSDQRKYYPWFEVKADAKHPGGKGLVFFNVNYGYRNSVVGSRLCLKTWDLAQHIAVTPAFVKIYENAYLIK